MDGERVPGFDIEKLAQTLSAGFEALLKEVEDLAKREASLRKQLEVAKKDVSITLLLSAFSSMTRNQKLALDRKS
jgi:chorismate-pyruvate lyase